MQGRFFNSLQPGEYGVAHKPAGFIMVTHEKLGRQRIFISSQDFREIIAGNYRIPPENIVSLINISETSLDGKKGLAIFQQQLSKLHNVKGDVLIHCKHGHNRSPVATVIYLVSRGFTAKEEITAVTSAFKSQRSEKFKLNSRGHYTAVLQEAFCLQENSSIHANTQEKCQNHH